MKIKNKIAIIGITYGNILLFNKKKKILIFNHLWEESLDECYEIISNIYFILVFLG